MDPGKWLNLMESHGNLMGTMHALSREMGVSKFYV